MSGKYDIAREQFMQGKLSWTDGPIVAQLVGLDYVYDPGHRTAADLKGRVGDPVELSGLEAPAGWARAQKIVFRQVKSGKPAAIVFHRNANEESQKTLIFFHDNVVNFPMTANGGDIEVEIPRRGIFRG